LYHRIRRTALPIHFFGHFCCVGCISVFKGKGDKWSVQVTEQHSKNAIKVIERKPMLGKEMMKR